MASVFKPAGAKRWVINYRDETGRVRKKTAYTDRRESQRLADKLEEDARKVRDGLVSSTEQAIIGQARATIQSHVDQYHRHLIDTDATAKHADLRTGAS